MNQSKTNILFISRAYSENAGGMERLSHEMINSISELKDQTIETKVLSHVAGRKTSPLFVFTVIPEALRMASKADVIHLGDPMLSIVGWLIKIFTKKPVAVTVHGLDITYKNSLYQLYLKLFFKNLDLYLPISTFVGDILKRMPVKGSIKVITPGIYDRFFIETPREKLSQLLNINSADKVVLATTGRLVKRKGHAWFISSVLGDLPDNYVYVIAGAGPELDNIKEAIKQNNLSEKVKLLGRVSTEDLATIYNTIDAFIQPNIKVRGDIEGFGLVLLEAALSSRPVLTAELEGMTSAIINNENGFLIESQNKEAWLKACLNLPEPNNAFRQYTLEKFSWNKKSKQYLESLLSITPNSSH